jgi:hypothetical protein
MADTRSAHWEYFSNTLIYHYSLFAILETHERSKGNPIASPYDRAHQSNDYRQQLPEPATSLNSGHTEL